MDVCPIKVVIGSLFSFALLCFGIKYKYISGSLTIKNKDF